MKEIFYLIFIMCSLFFVDALLLMDFFIFQKNPVMQVKKQIHENL